MFFGQFRLAKTSIHSKNILKFCRFIHDQILIIKHTMKNMKILDFGLFSNLKFSNKISAKSSTDLLVSEFFILK